MRLLSQLEKKSYSNATQAAIQLLKKLKVPVTNTTVIEQLENHPDYPSLLSISDSLKKWNVENMAIEVLPEKLEELPAPFIAHTKKGGGNFLLVTSVNGKIEYLDDKGREKQKSKEAFLKEWSHVALLAEGSPASGEKNYSKHRKKEILQSSRIPLIIACSLLLVFLFSYLQSAAGNPLWPSVMLLLKLAGAVISGLLLWFEVDKSNPVLKQFCTASKNTNCTAVISSKSSKLFNWLSWSEIGFFYFAGGFIFLLSSVSNHLSSFAVLSWLNLFTLPYIVFSVFYQWRIAKQWCPLCLLVQGILVAEFVVSYFGYWNTPQPFNFSTDQLIYLLTSFLLPVFFWIATKKIYLTGQQGERYKKELSKLKYNKEIFNALLIKQKKISVSAEGLGILLGNPSAPHTIIKVCNPYCGPCAKAHAVIDEILKENEDVKVQVIFTAKNDEADIKFNPVKHFMALYQTNPKNIHKVLDVWYGAEKKIMKNFLLPGR